MPHPTERCWCGYDQLVPFSPDYLRCPHCESLVVAFFPEPQTLIVSDDEKDFYGRQYYEELQVEKFGFPRLEERAVLDLPERCLHWLRAFLQYKVPPGKVLELGTAHGGFVALLRWMGFDATGLELSPWLVDFARKTFDIPVLEGPVEEQSIAPSSLDSIALMDVLEHLSDPVRTMSHCVSLMRNDGVLMIQTPRYREGKTYEEMLADNDRFVELLTPEQHLYLFSRTAIQRLVRGAGAGEVSFEKAIFDFYDMFLFASPSPLKKPTEQEIRCRLAANSSSRLIGALIDLDDRARQIDQNWRSAEADRVARLGVIEEQGRKLGEAERARNLLAAELAATHAGLEAAEADRAARLDVIEEQGRKLGEEERARNLLVAELAATRAALEAAEADRAARLDVIEEQGRKLGEAERAHKLLAGELAALREVFETAQRQLAEYTASAESLQTQNAALLNSIEWQSTEMAHVYDELSRLKRQRWIKFLMRLRLIRQ